MAYHPMQLADAFIKAGELEDALDALDTALENDPTDESAHRLRAGVLARLPGDDHRARALDDLRALSAPDADDALLESRLAQENGDLNAAIAAVENALTRYPVDPRLTERLLGLLRVSGDTSRANAVLSTLPDDDWRWRAWAGDIAADNRNYAAAITAYTAAIDLIAAKYPLPTSTASVVLDAGVSDAAALTVAGSVARLVLSRAHMYRQSGNLSAAGDEYAQAAIMLPDDPAIPFYQGIITALNGDTDAAVNLCRAALDAASTVVADHLRDELASDARLDTVLTRLEN